MQNLIPLPRPTWLPPVYTTLSPFAERHGSTLPPVVHCIRAQELDFALPPLLDRLKQEAAEAGRAGNFSVVQGLVQRLKIVQAAIECEAEMQAAISSAKFSQAETLCATLKVCLCYGRAACLGIAVVPPYKC